MLGRQDSFAWFTTRGDNRVVTTTEIGSGYMVMSTDHQWLVSHTMDGRRFLEEQTPEQVCELVTLYWHEGDPASAILELTKGMEIGADFVLPGARHCGAAIVDLHYPLTDLEAERYQWLDRTVNGILTPVARDL